MKKYRYYSSSLSRHMVPALKRHIAKIGCPLTARGINHGRGNGWYELVISGEKGKLVLRGCSWGYKGEGPHATRDVLMLLGIPQHEAEEIAFKTNGAAVGTMGAKGRQFFKVHLLPQPTNYTPEQYAAIQAGPATISS